MRVLVPERSPATAKRGMYTIYRPDCRPDHPSYTDGFSLCPAGYWMRWKNADESYYTGDLPEKIYVQLQRRQPDTVTWVSADGNANAYTELAGNMYTGKWLTSFTGLDKYVDYTLEHKIEWQYRP